MANNNAALLRETYILDDEKDLERSKKTTVYPKSTVDQIFDPQDNNKTLRQILNQMSDEIKEEGVKEIKFPVVTVNGVAGDDDGNVTIGKSDIGLSFVDNIPFATRGLTDPMKREINEMISGIDTETSALEINNHIHDLNNPHGVTLAQLDRNRAVSNLVENIVSTHNSDANAHAAITAQFRDLKVTLTGRADDNDSRVNEAIVNMNSHITDPDAHGDMFDEKENVSNKSNTIGDGDTTKYPSTKAVKEYVEDKISEYDNTLSIPGEWIADIRVLDSRSDIPSPSAAYERILFIVKNGLNGYQEIFICRKSNNGYYWDSSELASPTLFNSDHFLHERREISLNIPALGEILLNERNIAQRVDELVSEKLPDATSEFPTREELGHLVHKITILPGTMDGHIRYYENDDPSTMSDDVRVPGLQRLAYMENVSSNEILPESIGKTQIKPRAVQAMHLDDKILSLRNFSIPYNTLIGNLSDSTGDSAQNITLQQLANALAPFFEVQGDSIRVANIDY